MSEPRTSRGSAFNDEAMAVDGRAMRAYGAALDAYNSGNWDAVIIACGKAMEEVAKAELPYNERNGSLGHLLERLPKHMKVEQPLQELAGAVKDAKGLGAHFGLEGESNEEIARATLSLLESFVNYIYVFRAQVARLKELVDDKAQVEAQAQARERSKQVMERGTEATVKPTPVKPAGSPASPFDAFSKGDPYDIKGSNWNLGRNEE